MIEKLLFTELQAIFGGNVYPDVAPQGVSTPYCTYTRVSGQAVNTLCGSPAKHNARVQFNVWSTRREESIQKMGELRDALVTRLRAVVLEGVAYEYSDMVDLYGARQDFSLWWSE